MKKTLIMVSSVLILSMIFSISLAGCVTGVKEGKKDLENSKEENLKEETNSSEGTSLPRIDLVGYLLSDPPPGNDAVIVELNEKLKKDINTTIKINYMGWSDYTSKYPVVLASGEPLDFIYASSWTNYPENAAKGAFREVSLETIEKYMPRLFAKVPTEGWDTVLVNGKIYMIPQGFREIGCQVKLFRGDLRKKYDIPEIKKISDFKPYMEAIKANEEGMIPFNMSKAEITALTKAYTHELTGIGSSYVSSIGGGGESKNSLAFYNVDDDTYKLGYWDNEDYAKAFKEAAKWMYQLAEAGLITKNPYANATRSLDVILQGKTAIAHTNHEECSTKFSEAKKLGMELEMHRLFSPKGNINTGRQNNNGIALFANTKNPERTLMAFDLIMEDESYVTLLNFGIEGVNYVIKNGKLDLPEGVTAESNTYPLHAAGFFFCDRELWKPLATWDDYFIKSKEDLLKRARPYPLSEFSPTVESIKSELANCATVLQQYADPMSIGMVKDVDEAYDNLLSKLKAAGYEKIKEEADRQVNEFIKSRN